MIQLQGNHKLSTSNVTFSAQPRSASTLFEQPADSVHFSGKKPTPKTIMPYDVIAPTKGDRDSLRAIVMDDADTTGTILETIDAVLANYKDKGGLTQMLANNRTQPHQLSTQAAYRAKYAPVIALYRELGENGFLGLNVPEQYGGAGLENSLLTVELSRKLSKTDLGACTTILASLGLFGEPILGVGTEAQKQKYIPGILTGEKIGAFGLTEPDIGSDPGSVKTTAKASIGADGQRHWTLNGTKTFISNGNIADDYVIVARTIDEHGTDRGLSGFIVHNGQDGFTTHDVAGKDSDGKVGLHTSDTAELVLNDVDVPESDLIGEETGIGRGREIYDETLTGGRIGVGAQGLGIAEAALDAEIAYAKDRVQGKFKAPGAPKEIKPKAIPIANYPELREIIARDAIEVDAARQLAYHSARVKDAGLPFKKLASMTKLFATEMAGKRVTDNNIQVHGGMGFMEESGAGKLWRDARVLRIYEGTSQIQKLIIAGEVLGEVMSDPKLLEEPAKGTYPKDIYEVVDQALGVAIRQSVPGFGAAMGKFNHMKTAVSAIQANTYRIALIATEREAMLAMKAQVERLQAAGVDCTKEEAELRVFAHDTAQHALQLLSEIGVPYDKGLRRFASVNKLVDHGDVAVKDDLETVAQSLLGKSVFN